MDPYFDLVPAVEIDDILSEVAGPLLAAEGFRPVTHRRWVRAFAPIRHVFEVAAMKGASHVPRWGIALDFVPHVTSRGLAWHRTDKSVRMDLVYDPVDFDPRWEQRWCLEALRGPSHLRRDAERVLPAAIAEACDWLDGVRDEPAVLARAEWLRTSARPGKRFDFDAWVQQPLAYAILTARAGAREEGARLLDEWIARSQLAHLRDRLRTLLPS